MNTILIILVAVYLIGHVIIDLLDGVKDEDLLKKESEWTFDRACAGIFRIFKNHL